MDTEQRLEVLIQIARDYGLMAHMDANRAFYALKHGSNVGADIALVDMIVEGEGCPPPAYNMAMMRAKERLFGPEAK